MSQTLKKGAVQAAETVVATAILATPPGQVAVAGATALAVTAAPVVAFAAIAGGIIVGTFAALSKLEEICTRK